MMKGFVAAVFMMLAMSNLRAQNTGEGGLPDTGTIEILHSDNLFYESTPEGMLQRLTGHVKLLHDSTFMLCDSALILGKQVDARSHVVIIQGDSTRIYADTTVYDGDRHQADLYGKVVLQDKGQELFTRKLHYDLNTKIAHYDSSALLTDGTTYLRSKKGTYYVAEDYVYFEDSVIVVDTSFLLQADSLKYNTREDRAYFVGPTLIDTDSSSIYCEGGWFDFPTRDALFTGHPVYQKAEQKAEADSILYLHDEGIITLTQNAVVVEPEKRATADWIQYNQRTKDIWMKGDAHYRAPGKEVDAEEIFYNSETEVLRTQGRSVVVDGSRTIRAESMDYDKGTGMSIATGHVIIVDTTDHYELHCDRVVHDKKTGFMKATGERPWMLQVSDGDSLFIGADTILSRQISETDTSRILKAWHHVKMYSDDFQGLCDSLVWYEQDSSFELLQDPVLWSDTSQFLGDTIRIFVEHDAIQRVHQIKHAFIISTEEEVLFNQLKGREILTNFDQNQPKRSHITGNAEVVYYLVDDNGAYVAGNKTECSEMVIEFKDKKVDMIRFYKQPKGQMKPLKEKGVKEWRLEGFRWIVSRRPTSPVDVILK